MTIVPPEKEYKIRILDVNEVCAVSCSGTSKGAADLIKGCLDGRMSKGLTAEISLLESGH